MELNIQKYLRTNEFYKFIEKYIDTKRLKIKYYKNYQMVDSLSESDIIHIKYNQIYTKYDNIEQECRGIILDSKTFDVVSYPLSKFFNGEEEKAHTLDSNNLTYYKKEDGTFICLYFYNNKWNVSTTGTAFGEGKVENSIFTENNITYKDLFWDTLIRNNVNIEELKESLNTDMFYMFELMTPKNIVVEPHEDYKLSLIAVRNKTSLLELDIESNLIKDYFNLHGINIVKKYDFNNIEDMQLLLEQLEWFNEGFIVLDKNTYNRQKWKNASYVAIHHGKAKDAEWRMLTIIIKNEIDEYLVYFPERRELIYKLKDAYTSMVTDLLKFSNSIFNSNLYEDFCMDYNFWTKVYDKRVALSKAKKEISSYIALNIPKNIKFLTSFFFDKLENPMLEPMDYINEKFSSQDSNGLKVLFKRLKPWINKTK